MKNLLTQWEIEEKNRKIGGKQPLIDREHSGNVLLINSKHGSNILLLDSKHSGNVLLIDKELVELEDDAECASLLKLTEFMKKHFKQTKTGKEKPHRSISNSFAYFDEPVGRPCFCFTEAWVGLTDGLAMGGAESKKEKVTINFFG